MRDHERAAAVWGLDLEAAVEGGNPIAEPHQTAAVGPGAAYAVVADLGP